jgi:hypothetical protein
VGGSQGRRAEAAELSRLAVEEFRGKNWPGAEAAARNHLALALLEQDRADAAGTALEGAAELASRSSDLQLRLAVAISAARVRAASGRPEDAAAARSSLEATAAQARNAGFMCVDLEARLALGRLELRAPETAAAGQVRLAEVAREAQARGYGLISGKAQP